MNAEDINKLDGVYVYQYFETTYKGDIDYINYDEGFSVVDVQNFSRSTKSIGYERRSKPVSFALNSVKILAYTTGKHEYYDLITSSDSEIVNLGIKLFIQKYKIDE